MNYRAWIYLSMARKGTIKMFEADPEGELVTCGRAIRKRAEQNVDDKG